MRKKFYVVLAVGLIAVSCKKNEKADAYIDQSAMKDTATATTTTTGNPVQTVSVNPQSPVAANAAPQTVTPQVQNVTPVQNAAPVKTTPGMNPPHGQPGHRCDIAVGAPLTSTPAKTSTNSAPVQTQTLPATVAAPQNVQTQTAASGAKPATNPEHGQPHHRCDLAVGVPLP